MQKVTIKFLISILVSLVFQSPINADSLENELVKADSLYSIKLFTQSIELYESVLEKEKASPAMLLKMARIEEGLNNYGKAIFYLEKYFELTEDKRSLEYIQQIAEKEKLSGYSYSFPYYLSFYYDKWQPTIILLLSAFLLVLIALLLKNRHHASKKRQYLVFTIFVLFLTGLSNNLQVPQYAIVLNTPTFMWEGPSAASNTIERLNKNHRIPVKETLDVWTETQWNDGKAYIKTDHLKKL